MQKGLSIYNMFGWFKKKKKEEQNELVPIENNEVAIRFSALPSTEVFDERQLVPITDKRLLARVADVAPNFLQVAQSTKVIGEARDAISSVGEVYQAIIPNGAKLMDSKAIGGAKRGAFLDVNNNLGQANLVKVDVDGTLQKVANNQVASFAFNVASMVVGQYYMTQINGELDKIADDVSRISTFQNSEYLSKITATIKQIREISEYQAISLENEELRLEEKRKLNSLKEKCTELLDQANHSINNLMQQKDLDFKGYIGKANEIEMWRKYQIVLLEILYQISSLIQVFSMGMEPAEKVFSTFNQCKDESEMISSNLVRYHSNVQKELKISVDKKTISNGRIVEFVAELFHKEEWKERQMPQGFAVVLEEQMKPLELHKSLSMPKYDEEVVLIAKEGELYYLPNEVE